MIIKNLYESLRELTLDEAIVFTEHLRSYSKNTNFPSELYLSLCSGAFESVRVKTMKVKFDTKDVTLIIRAFELFLDNTDTRLITKIKEDKAIEQLITLLLLPRNRFNLEQSVNILRILKEINQTRCKNLDQLIKMNLLKLITKCNETIIEELISEPNDDSVWYYCNSLHEHTDVGELNFANLYDPKVLDLIAPIVIENEEPENLFVISNLIDNFQQICDERILRYIYKQVFLQEEPNDVQLKIAIGKFMILSEFRLPFVDYERTTKFLFDNLSFQISKMMATSGTYKFKFLSQLLLVDTVDERLGKYFESLQYDLAGDFAGRIPRSVYLRLVLAKVNLSMFSKMPVGSRRRIESEMNNFLQAISRVKQKELIEKKSMNHAKLAESVFLSNGLYLKTFAIYDKSIKDLVPLSKFVKYFHEIDKAPLNENQQLLTFLEEHPAKGNVAPYERNSYYQLKKILNEFNIRWVEVLGDDLKSIDDPREKAFFLIDKALTSLD